MNRSIDEQLLDCLQGTVNPVARARLDSTSESAWNQIIQASAKHGLSPLLYDRLNRVFQSKEHPLNKVQESALKTLRESYLMNGVRNALLYQDLKQVLDALGQRNIKTIVLKGAHLAQLVYGHIGLRQMGDTDLLVQKSDVPKAVASLVEMGYSWAECDIDQWCSLHCHLPPFTKPPHPRIEVHWALTDPTRPFRLDLDGLWNRARSTTIADAKTLILSPEDLLLHLCVHTGGPERGSFSLGLRPLCDIAATIEFHREEIDWDVLDSRAREWRSQKCVHLALWLCKELMNAPVPEPILRSLAPADFDEHWGNAAKDIVLAGEPVEEMRLMTSYADRCGAARLSDKLKFLLSAVFPNRNQTASYTKDNHSRAVNPIKSYTLRAMDLLGHFARLVWYVITHPEETATRARLVRKRFLFQQWVEGKSSKN